MIATDFVFYWFVNICIVMVAYLVGINIGMRQTWVKIVPCEKLQ